MRNKKKIIFNISMIFIIFILCFNIVDGAWFNVTKQACYDIEFSTSSGLTHEEPVYIHVTNESDVVNFTFIAKDITDGVNYSLYTLTNTDNYTEATIVNAECSNDGSEVPYSYTDNTTSFELPNFTNIVNMSWTTSGAEKIFKNQHIEYKFETSSGGLGSTFYNSSTINYHYAPADHTGFAMFIDGAYVIGYDAPTTYKPLQITDNFIEVLFVNNNGVNYGNVTYRFYNDWSGFIAMPVFGQALEGKINLYYDADVLTNNTFNTSYVDGASYPAGGGLAGGFAYSTDSGISNGKGLFSAWNGSNDFSLVTLWDETITDYYSIEDNTNIIDSFGFYLGKDSVGGFNMPGNTIFRIINKFVTLNGVGEGQVAEDEWTKFSNPLTNTIGALQSNSPTQPLFTSPTPINNTWINIDDGDPTFNFSSTAGYNITYRTYASINVSNLTDEESIVNTNISIESGTSVLYTFDVNDNQTWFYDIKAGNDTSEGTIANSTQSETRQFKTDFTSPILILDNIPDSTSSISTCEENITINITHYDEYIENCTYSIYRVDTDVLQVANTTFVCSENVTVTSPSGCGVEYIVRTYNNDSANNVNYTFDTYTISAEETIITTTTTGGDGGDAPPLLCKDSGQSWIVQSRSETGGYDAQISSGIERNFIIQARNNASTSTDLYFSCVDDLNATIKFCSQINISKTVITLPANQEKFEEVEITITPPENLENGVSYFPSIFVEDKIACSGLFSFKLTVTPFGKLWKTYTIPLSELGDDIEDFKILSIILVFPLSILIFFLTFFLFARVLPIKSPSLGVFLGLLSGLNTFILLIFIL